MQPKKDTYTLTINRETGQQVTPSPGPMPEYVEDVLAAALADFMQEALFAAQVDKKSA